MGSLDSGWITLVSLVRDAGRCIQSPFATAACDFFWPVVIGLVIAAGLVGLFLIGRVFLRDYVGHRRAMSRWHAEQEVAPPEVMEETKWRGDSSASEGLSQAELTARIKEQLARQRNKAGREGSGGQDP
jgi:hypothetical protein